MDGALETEAKLMFLLHHPIPDRQTEEML